MTHWNVSKRARRLFMSTPLIALLAGGCTSFQTPSLERGSELSAMPLREPLSPDLAALRDQGLEFRGAHVEFVGELDLPPSLKDVPATSSTHLRILPSGRPPIRVERETQRAVALASPSVALTLGNRFALLRSGWVETAKDAPQSNRYQLTFYNYSKNELVTVTTERREVVEVKISTVTVQPSESGEEVDLAIGIVRQDDRHGRHVEHLLGRGIQTPSPKGEDDPDRYLFLMFFREARTAAVFAATVNMSAGHVESAHQVR